MKLFTIAHKTSGATLFGGSFNSLKLCVEAAVIQTSSLIGANLRYANLSGADLVDGGQRSDGHRFVGWVLGGVLQIRAGCCNFTIHEARDHWRKTRAGTPLGEETFVILDHIELVAKIRGLVE